MNEQKKQNNSQEKEVSSFQKYIGLSFQLFTTIALGTYIGWLVQQQSKMKFPLWILLFCFISVLIAFYHLWISVKRNNKY